MRPGTFTSALALLGCVVLSCKAPAPAPDSGAPEVASEFRGVAVAPGASGGAQAAAYRDGGSAGSDAQASRCPVDLTPAAMEAVKVKLERKVNDGTASDDDVRTLIGMCFCLDDKPCLEWANALENGGWRARDGGILRRLN